MPANRKLDKGKLSHNPRKLLLLLGSFVVECVVNFVFVVIVVVNVVVSVVIVII